MISHATRCSILITLSLLGSACASRPTVSRYSGKREVVWYEDQLRDQAGFLMECAPAELQVTRMGSPQSAGVMGCGKRVLFK